MNKVFKWVLTIVSTCLVFYFSYKAIEKVHFPLGNARLQLEVQCSIDNKFKVYYSRSSEFSSKKMVEVKLKGNKEFQTLDFVFPSSFNADKFRLHMGAEEATVRLKSMQLISEGSYRWDSHKLFSDFKPQMIKSYLLKDGFIEVIPNGENPFLQNVHTIYPIVESVVQNKFNALKPLVYSIVLSIFFYAVMHYLLFYTIPVRADA